VLAAAGDVVVLAPLAVLASLHTLAMASEKATSVGMGADNGRINLSSA